MLRITLEPWSLVEVDVQELAEKHFVEVDGGLDERRKFKINSSLMQLMCETGSLKILTAREDGKMVGYYTWQIMPDVESEGLLIAMQGAWFVLPNKWRLAHKMFKESLKMLKNFGVIFCFPHHRMQGRGKSLGKFFLSQGAVATQISYMLKIGK